MTDTSNSLPVLAKRALEASGGGLVAILKAIAPAPAAVPANRPVTLPKITKLTPEQIQAIEALPRAIELSAEVTPTTRRKLTVQEIDALITERKLLDQVEAVIKARKESQKVAAFNHQDVVLEETGKAEGLEVDDNGWYVTKSAAASNHEKTFVRTLREESPTLDAEGLEAVIGTPLEDGTEFTRDDYLAMTTQVRVLDEAKATLRLRARPAIAAAWRAAMRPGKKTTAHTLGKA